uniref:major coat protein n=1 Tax=Rheinheimera sp. TaxID=1869214 RepID=UPI0040475C07
MKQKNLILTALVVSAAVVSGSAMAAADSASAAMASISTEASTLIAAAWPILTTVVVAFISMKLFRKAASKAT